MDHCTENEFMQPAYYNSYEYLRYLLYAGDNSLTGSIKWSSDGRYLKINYSHFASEYLATGSGPADCENVFSFIKQVESCGFTYVPHSCDDDTDVLTFERLEHGSFFYPWRNGNSYDDKVKDNYIFSQLSRVPDYYFQPGREDRFDDDEIFPSTKNSTSAEISKFHQNFDTTVRKCTTPLPKHFPNYHSPFPGVNGLDNTPQSSPNHRSRLLVYEQQKLSSENCHQQNVLEFEHSPAVQDPCSGDKRIHHFHQNAANYCEPENSQYYHQADSPWEKRTTHLPKHFQNYHLEFPRIKSRDSTPKSSPNRRGRGEDYQILTPESWHQQNVFEYDNQPAFQDPCREDEGINHSHENAANYCESEVCKHYHQAESPWKKRTTRIPKRFQNYRLEFPRIKSRDSTPQSSPNRRRRREDDEHEKLSSGNWHRQNIFEFEHCPEFQDPYPEDERFYHFYENADNSSKPRNSKYHQQEFQEKTNRTPKHFLNYHLEYPRFKNRNSTPNSSRRRKTRRRTRLFPENKRRQNDLGFEHCPIFQDPEYRMKIMFYEDDDDDTCGVFLREKSGNVMLSEGCKIDFSITQLVDQPTNYPKFICICPLRVSASVC